MLNVDVVLSLCCWMFTSYECIRAAQRENAHRKVLRNFVKFSRDCRNFVVLKELIKLFAVCAFYGDSYSTIPPSTENISTLDLRKKSFCLQYFLSF